jgi:CO dehydrogenase nickel-insertion accessory protein CooC1
MGEVMMAECVIATAMGEIMMVGRSIAFGENCACSHGHQKGS